ncbi:SixA phosphatase family protein [Pokkaliibacter sp. CJK22405]|uniref:SixA phosphatase family protein n=1 Tax=Pokkaliibacter sp. CJK22405 TaxID=3384615 RepID=UPI003984694B
MKWLTLMRHAKSSWDDPTLSDHERPLNERGRHAAELMQQRLLHYGLQPQGITLSDARRCRQTLALMPEILSSGFVLENPALYESSAYRLLESLRGSDNSVNHLLMIGHNPGIQELIQLLCGHSLERFPTAAIATLQLQINDWQELDDNCGTLCLLDRPKAKSPSRFAPLEISTVASSSSLSSGFSGPRH